MQELLRPPSLDEEKSPLLLVMGLLNLVQVAENHYCPAADLCKTACFFFFSSWQTRSLWTHVHNASVLVDDLSRAVADCTVRETDPLFCL